MDVQLIREKIRMEQPLGHGEAQALVTGEVTLPGGLREETRVLAARADAAVERAEAIQGRISVRGRVMFHVLYTQGDASKVRAIEASADFVQPVELAGVQPHSAVQAMTEVEHVEARANGGRISLRAEVAVHAAAALQEPVEAIMAVEGADDVQVRTQAQTIRRTAASGDADAMLREELALPDGLHISETLFAQAYPLVEVVTGSMSRVGLSGQVLLEAIHATDMPGRPVVVTRHSIPFAHSVEITGEDGDALGGTAVIRDVAVASQDDGEGVTMRAEVLLGMHAWADVTEPVDLLADAYTITGKDIRLQGSTVRCRTGSTQITAAESGKAAILLPDSAPPVRTVLLALAQPELEQHECHGGRTTLTGKLEVTLLYMTEGDDAPVSLRLKEPFRVSCAADIADDAMISLAVTEAEAVPITSDRLELRYILRIQAWSTQMQEMCIMTGGETVSDEPLTADMVLYYVQPGERLWDVARRYRVPAEDVRALNPGLEDEVAPGQGIIVWRRAAMGS